MRRTWLRLPHPSMVVVLATLLLAACFTTALPARPAQAATPIVGAGSTWSQLAVDQWRSDVARYGLSINYIGNGSSQGRAWFAGGQSDFAVSEIPYEGDEMKPDRGFVYLPIVAGGTSLMYNLTGTNGSRITSLNLSSASAVGIFTGTISSWRDPLILKENPDLADVLPDTGIVPVVRSDGSGTSAQFSAYLSSMQGTAWSNFSKEDHVSFWPTFTGGVSQQGSDGVANFVANASTGANSITYVERGYATNRRFPTANLENASGKFTQSDAQNVAIALQHATFNKDGTQNLSGVYRAPEADAYAMSSYSYMIAPTSGLEAGKGETLGKFIIYFACDGQRQAESLGYSPMPPNLVQNAFDAVRKIPGAPEPPTTGECGSKELQDDVLDGTSSPEAAAPATLASADALGTSADSATTTSTPGTIAGASAPGTLSGTEDPSGGDPTALGATGLPEGVDPTTTSTADQEIVLAAAADVQRPSLGPSILSGIALLALVFGPLFVRRRSAVRPSRRS